jgi:hypothetical protein
MAERSSDPSHRTPNGGVMVSRVSTYVVTNGIKVLGAYVVLAEQAGQGRNWVLLAGAALALGAQTVERIALAVIERFFGTASA